jgi:hypothetical protein
MEQVDHRDHDTLDNTRANLRLATAVENSRNQRRSRNNRSGFKGVSFHKRAGKWHAQITTAGKRRHLGYFAAAETAAFAYNLAAVQHFGDFAVLNEGVL